MYSQQDIISFDLNNLGGAKFRTYIYIILGVACALYPHFSQAQFDFSPAAALNLNAEAYIGLKGGTAQGGDVATDGASTWIAAWTSTNTFGYPGLANGDINITRSTDNASTWSFPTPLYTDTFGGAWDQSASVATDRSGNWMVVWSSAYNLGGIIGDDRDLLFVRSSDNGLTWSDPLAVTATAATDIAEDYFPSLIAGENGTLGVVWTAKIDDKQSVLFASTNDFGNNWSSVAALGENTASDIHFVIKPALETDGYGNWIAVWASNLMDVSESGSDIDLLVRFSHDNGNSWSPHGFINSTDDGDRADLRPDIQTDRFGTWLVAWETQTTNAESILASHSIDGGVSWTSEITLSLGGSNSVVSLASDGPNSWQASWSNISQGFYRDGQRRITCCQPPPVYYTTRILHARSMADATDWTAPTSLYSFSAVPHGSSHADLTLKSDELGILRLFYSGNKSLLKIQSEDGGIAWSDPAGVGYSLTGQRNEDDKLAMASDGGRRLVSAWFSKEHLGNRGSAIYAQRSEDHGASWSDIRFLTGETEGPSDIESINIANGRPGVWITAWSDIVSDEDTYIYFARTTDDGISWSAPGLFKDVVSQNAGSRMPTVTPGLRDTQIKLKSDGTGNWVAIWRRQVSNTQELLAARSTDDGATWRPPFPLDPQPTVETSLHALETDQNGTWVAVWESKNRYINSEDISYDTDILVSRSTNNGSIWSILEPLNSNAFTDGTKDFDVEPSIATDGAGNWIAAWRSYTSSGYGSVTGDIRVSRSLDSAVTWSPLTSIRVDPLDPEKPAQAVNPQIIYMGNGEWILAWEENFTTFRYSVSRDVGVTWSPYFEPQVIEPGGINRERVIAPSGMGGMLVSWSSYNSLGGTIGDDVDLLYSTVVRPYIYSPESFFIQGGGALRLR